MTQRVTIGMLEARVAYLNKITGNPPEPYTKGDDGKYSANIGNFHLGEAYGGVALHQMMGEGGGIRDIFGGHGPKRELLEQMSAYIRGLQDAKGS